MLKSLKQLLRTPVKAVLFFLLMTAATALLVLGAGLWLNTQHRIGFYDDWNGDAKGKRNAGFSALECRNEKLYELFFAGI